MGSYSTEPQVLTTSGASARSLAISSRSTSMHCLRSGAWIATGVVTGDQRTTSQGTAVPFAAVPGSARLGVDLPRQHKNSVSGITASSPPV